MQYCVVYDITGLQQQQQIEKKHFSIYIIITTWIGVKWSILLIVVWWWMENRSKQRQQPYRTKYIFGWTTVHACRLLYDFHSSSTQNKTIYCLKCDTAYMANIIVELNIPKVCVAGCAASSSFINLKELVLSFAALLLCMIGLIALTYLCMANKSMFAAGAKGEYFFVLPFQCCTFRGPEWHNRRHPAAFLRSCQHFWSQLCGPTFC